MFKNYITYIYLKPMKTCILNFYKTRGVNLNFKATIYIFSSLNHSPKEAIDGLTQHKVE